MADFLTITEKYLKEKSIVNENTDMKVITPVIILVQDKYIKPLLGSDLFDQIKSQIIASTVSANNQTLLDDYILPCMLWYTLAESTPAFKYRYMNKGIMVKNSENSSAADLQEIQFLMDNWRNNGEMYAERCTRYLVKNRNTYTLYDANPDSDDIKPNTTNYTSGLALDDPGDCCCEYD